MQPNVVDLRYFKLWILLNQIIFEISKVKPHQVAKIQGSENFSLCQRLNSFLHSGEIIWKLLYVPWILSAAGTYILLRGENFSFISWGFSILRLNIWFWSFYATLSLSFKLIQKDRNIFRSLSLWLTDIS